MIIDKNPNNISKISGFEVLNQFIYLGSLIANNVGRNDKIKIRVTIARR